MRFVAAGLLVLLAVYAGMLAWGALQNLFAAYRDSPTVVYLIVGLPALAVCLGALYGAVRLLRG